MTRTELRYRCLDLAVSRSNSLHSVWSQTEHATEPVVTIAAEFFAFVTGSLPKQRRKPARVSKSDKKR